MHSTKKYYEKNLLDDSEHLLMIKQDDEASFQFLYDKYWAQLYLYAYNILNEKSFCEDIVQDIFVDLWNRRTEVKINNLKSYLYRSIKLQIFKNFRKSKYKKQLLEKFDPLFKSLELYESYENKERVDQIDNIIEKLPSQRQIIFKMSKYEGLSNKEISDNLEISLQTVKNQISSSLKFIRQSLKIFFLF